MKQSDGDQVQHSSNSRDLKKSVMSGKSLNGGSGKPAASDHRQGPRRSLSQNPIKYHDGYSVSHLFCPLTFLLEAWLISLFDSVLKMLCL